MGVRGCVGGAFAEDPEEVRTTQKGLRRAPKGSEGFETVSEGIRRNLKGSEGTQKDSEGLRRDSEGIRRHPKEGEHLGGAFADEDGRRLCGGDALQHAQRIERVHNRARDHAGDAAAREPRPHSLLQAELRVLYQRSLGAVGGRLHLPLDLRVDALGRGGGETLRRRQRLLGQRLQLRRARLRAESQVGRGQHPQRVA